MEQARRCSLCDGLIDPWSVLDVSDLSPEQRKKRYRFGELEYAVIPVEIKLDQYPAGGDHQCFHYSCLLRNGFIPQLIERAKTMNLSRFGHDEVKILVDCLQKRRFMGKDGPMTLEEIEKELVSLVQSGIPRVGGSYWIESES